MAMFVECTQAVQGARSRHTAWVRSWHLESPSVKEHVCVILCDFPGFRRGHQALQYPTKTRSENTKLADHYSMKKIAYIW
jgi:hypothetical protein